MVVTRVLALRGEATESRHDGDDKGREGRERVKLNLMSGFSSSLSCQPVCCVISVYKRRVIFSPRTKRRY